MIAMQNIIDDKDALLSIIFDISVMKHLKCKTDDYLIVLQSNFNPNLFLIAKADHGYRIRKYPKFKKTFQVNIRFPFKFVPEFDWKECTYFLKKNNSIRIKINFTA